jgi:hypothetical protein
MLLRFQGAVAAVESEFGMGEAALPVGVVWVRAALRAWESAMAS